MALLIPDSLRSRKDVPDAVRRMAGALGTALDDDVTVWYEPLFDHEGSRPDLVVLDPRSGVVVIEVLKGTGRSKLLGAVGGEIRMESDGKESTVSSPIDRAEAFAQLLRAAVQRHPTIADVPIGAVAAFTGVTRDRGTALNLGTAIDLRRCLFKDDIQRAAEEADPSPLLRAFVHATGRSLSGLSEAQLDLLRGVIHADAVVHPPEVESGALFSAAAVDGDVMKVMDRQQERLAKSIGSGHRVIRGVAGSGKTLVLVHRARLLARVMPTKRVLVTCFTRSLASQLRAQLTDLENVEVRHIDKLMTDAIEGAGLEHPGYDGDEPKVAKAALTAIEKREPPKYRAVLIDEAQDFDTEALKFCVKLLEATDVEEQDLIIVADSAQNIFRKKFAWSDAGVKAQGRTRLLRTNYRNTRETLAFAHAFLTADKSIEVQQVLDPDDGEAIIAAQAAKRSGPVPSVIAAGDLADEVAKVVEAVKERYHPRLPSRSIAVLYSERSPGMGDVNGQLAAALSAAKLPFFWVTDPDNKGNRDLVGEADLPIVLSTVHSAKGLEFPSVVLCGLGTRGDRTTARKLVYVGMTRAISDLTVVVGGESPFRADLLRLHDELSG